MFVKGLGKLIPISLVTVGVVISGSFLFW